LEKLHSKEEDEVEVVQLVDVVLRKSSGEAPARWRGFNGVEEREREREV